MKTILCTLTIVLCLASFAPGVTVQKAALEAQEAYDDARYSKAIEYYEQIIAEGTYAPEIFYNLGNACFKSGDLPNALLNYRRAWYFTPGDPDLQTNIELAAKSAGVTLPKQNLIQRISYSLPQRRWIQVALGAYLLFSLLITATVAWPAGQTILLKLAALSFILGGVACLGINQWWQLYQSAEQIIITKTDAKFGPTENSTKHFKTLPGSIVSVNNSTTKNWQEINLNGETGWVRKDFSAPVVIWKF